MAAHGGDRHPCRLRCFVVAFVCLFFVVFLLTGRLSVSAKCVAGLPLQSVVSFFFPSAVATTRWPDTIFGVIEL